MGDQRGRLRVYVANIGSESLTVLSLDSATGALTPIQTVAVGGAVMPLAVNHASTRLYAAVRSQPYQVLSFAIAPDGGLDLLGVGALADSMAYVAVDATDQWLLAASYPGHTISVNAVDASGVAQDTQQTLPAGRHAHCIRGDRSNAFWLSTSLGDDCIKTWRFDPGTGQLSAEHLASTEAPPGSGPRHFAWSAKQEFLYLLGELDASVSVFAYDTPAGKLALLQQTHIAEPGTLGKPWAADLHLSPDGRHLYASERSMSLLTVFAVNPTDGTLGPPQSISTEACPRSFTLSPDGKYLACVGQQSDHLSLYKLDAETGLPQYLARIAVGKSPSWVEIIQLPDPGPTISD